ncbi:MAG: hypothetical protein R2705_00930 [Ilumatobacteraceae bacterium]
MTAARASLPSVPAPEWLGQSDGEEILDPGQRIIDPHHHLWPAGGALPYGPDELAADLASGHDVVATVYMECRSIYRADGPDHLRPVGETEFVVDAARSMTGPTISGIVGHTDLRLDPALIDEALDAHEAAGAGMFRGIRHAGSLDPEPERLAIPGRAPAGLYADDAFRRGVRRLGERRLTYDTWHYHHQNRDFLEVRPVRARDAGGVGPLRNPARRGPFRRSPGRVVPAVAATWPTSPRARTWW